MMPAPKPLLLFLIVIVLLAAGSLSATESLEGTVTAEGMAGIINNDKPKARDQAMNHALRNAVEQAVGTIISSETMVANYEVLSDNIYSRTHGYVQNYQVLNEKAEEGLYHVTIRASVTTSGLKNDLAALGLLMARKNMPRVMIVVAEQNVGSERYTSWWSPMGAGTDVHAGLADLGITENSLMKFLTEKGFHLVDHGMKTGQVKIAGAYQIDNLSNNTIRDIGRLYEAEIVIYGKALAKLGGAVLETSMKSAQADLALRVVNTDTGQVIASVSDHGAAIHPNEVTAGTEALRKTTATAAEDLVRQIMNRWGADVGGKGLVNVRLSNITAYQDLELVKDLLQNRIRGIGGIYQRSFAGATAVLDVESPATAKEIADQLAGHKDGGLTFQILNISQNSIEVKLNRPVKKK